jgi:hypothetical protein
MASSSSDRASDHTTDATAPDGADQMGESTGVRITVIVQNRYRFDTAPVTGAQIKEAANIPADFALYRRAQGGNEPILDALVHLRNGDHFFARPSSDATIDRGGG